MHKLTIRELSQSLYKKEISSMELTRHFLERIKQHNQLNAFIHIDEEHALLSAKAADERLFHGLGDVLTGIPMAHKDIFCTKTMPTTCASKILEGYRSPYDASIVKRFNAQNSVLIGKTNMDEFAMGSTNESSYFKPVKNPWNINYVPGGSSGGSAASVAASLVPFATGSDTGGSIRQPAAFCGISGIKPTYGLVSRYGMVAFASSLDQAGPMARSSDDLALLLECMAGFDSFDSTSINQSVPKFSNHLNKPLGPLRIGISDEFFSADVDEIIQQSILKALDVFKQAGAQINTIALPMQPYYVPCYYVIACAEASSNLARYDGVRFGYRSPNAQTLTDLITHTRDEGFGIEVKRRILTGTHVLCSGYYDDYYIQAQKVRRMIQQELMQSFTKIDVIIGPTTPTCAFEIGEEIDNPTKRYLADQFTVGANLAGIPALSIPVGFNKQNLPIGMQIIGPHFSEARLLQVGHYFQQQTNWHQKYPEDFV